MGRVVDVTATASGMRVVVEMGADEARTARGAGAEVDVVPAGAAANLAELERAVRRLPAPPAHVGDGPDERVGHVLGALENERRRRIAYRNDAIDAREVTRDARSTRDAALEVLRAAVDRHGDDVVAHADGCDGDCRPVPCGPLEDLEAVMIDADDRFAAADPGIPRTPMTQRRTIDDPRGRADRLTRIVRMLLVDAPDRDVAAFDVGQTMRLTVTWPTGDEERLGAVVLAAIRHVMKPLDEALAERDAAAVRAERRRSSMRALRDVAGRYVVARERLAAWADRLEAAVRDGDVGRARAILAERPRP